MSEQSPLMQNIDKVSYATAGVLGLVILALAFLSGGDLAKATSDLRSETEDLQAKLDDDEGSSAVPRVSRPYKEDLENQWKIDASAEKSQWLTERAQILLRKIDVPDPEPAVHEPGYVAGIYFERDSEKKKPFLRVAGKVGSNNAHVEITGLELFKREGQGEPTQVSGVTLAGDGFEYRDYGIAAGKQYSYMFKTTAKTVDAKLYPLAEDAVVQEAQELGPTLEIPFDVYISITTVSEAGGEPVLSGKKAIVDYATGEVIRDKSSKPYREGDKLDQAGRWTIRRISQAGGSTEIVIKDNQGGPSIRIGRKKLSVDPIPPVEGGPTTTEASGDDDDDDDDDDASAANDEGTEEAPAEEAGKPAEEEAPKPTKRPRKRRGFGN